MRERGEGGKRLTSSQYRRLPKKTIIKSQLCAQITSSDWGKKKSDLRERGKQHFVSLGKKQWERMPHGTKGGCWWGGRGCGRRW